MICINVERHAAQYRLNCANEKKQLPHITTYTYICFMQGAKEWVKLKIACVPFGVYRWWWLMGVVGLLCCVVAILSLEEETNDRVYTSICWWLMRHRRHRRTGFCCGIRLLDFYVYLWDMADGGRHIWGLIFGGVVKLYVTNGMGFKLFDLTLWCFLCCKSNITICFLFYLDKTTNRLLPNTIEKLTSINEC